MELLHRSMTRGHILFLYNPTADPHLSHVSIITNYAAGFLRAGYLPVFLHLNQEGWQKKLLELLAHPDLRLVLCNGGWGGNLLAEDNGVRTPLFARYGKTVINVFGDYPFAPWVYDKVADEYPGKFSFHTDRATPLLVSRFAAHPERHHYIPTLCQDNRFSRPRAFIPPHRRRWPFLYVGGFHDVDALRAKYLQANPARAAAFDALIDQALWDFHRPIWQTAESVLAAHSLPCDWKDPALRDFVHHGNQFVRFKRREVLLRKLCAYPGYFILASNRPRDLAFHPDAVVTGATPVPQTLELFYDARAVVMSLPNFACGHSERMLNAMHRGCVAVSTRNVVVDEEFVPDTDYLPLQPGFANLEEQLARLENPSLCASLAASAFRAVEQHHLPDDIIRHVLDTLNAASANL